MLTLVSNINKIAVFILVITLASFSLIASDGHDQPAINSHEEEFDASKFVLDHIGDSHEWHIITTRDGHHISVPLPIILLSKNSGLHFFMSDKLAHGHEYKGFRIMKEGEHVGSIVEINEKGEITGTPLDFSMTKNVAGMLAAVIILFLVFIKMGSVYKREGVTVPRGISSFLEPLIIFIRDKIALPNIGEKKYEKYTPFLLTTFFFILFNNILGLVPIFPFGANVTGNIAVTLVLAMFTFVITTISGSKDYWMHIFATPGIPKWLLPIMVPVEIIGMFTKPFALMIRLFANITAGHIIIISLISLIFIFKSLSVAPISVALVLFMEFLELLVAFLQAYVFTMLSALFIGLAVKEHHH